MAESSERTLAADARALIDEGTLLANSRGWEAAIEAVDARADAHSPVTVLSVVLDAAAGSGLWQLGGAVAWAIRARDVAARLGDDEIAILAPICPDDEARTLRRRVEEALASIGISGTIGTATGRPGEHALGVWRRAETARGAVPRERAPGVVHVEASLSEQAAELMQLLSVGGGPAGGLEDE